jgi:hypothetical protein
MTNSPWNPLPTEPQGDSDAKLLYHAVGVALSQWESVEDALAGLYTQLIGSRSQSARDAYGSVASGKGRFNMIMAAAGAAGAAAAS